MGRARNLANLKPNADGLIEADDIAPGAVQTSVSALEATIPLASGASVTQQKTVFMDWAGQVGKQAQSASEAITLESAYGTTQGNFFSKTRMGPNQSLSYESTWSTSTTVTFTLYVRSGEFGWTSLTFTRSAPSMSGSGMGATYYGGQIKWVGGNKYIITTYAQNYDPSYNYYYAYDICPIDIDPVTGSYTLGSQVNVFGKTMNGGLSIHPLEDGVNGMIWWGSNRYIYTLGNSGSTPTLSWGGSFPSEFTNSYPAVNFKTASGSYVSLHNSGVYRYSISSSTVSNFTTESLPAGISSVGYTKILSPTAAFITFGRNIATIELNPTTGVITATGVASLASAGRDINYIEFSTDNRKGLITLHNYNNNFYDTVYVVPFSINANNVLSGYGIPLIIQSTTSRPQNYGWYTGGALWQGSDRFDIYTINAYSSSSNKIVRVTVPENAYTAGTLNLIGIAKSSASSGNATVVTSGIIGGFTGLVPGLNYYADITNTNGDITTTQNNYLVGFAVSPTQIRR